MMYSQIDSLFREITGDTNEVFWTAAQKLAWANEAIAAAARRSRAIEKRTTILAVAGTGEYTLPADVESVQRVAWNGVALEPTTQMNLSRSGKEWTDDQGIPFQFYLDGLNGKIGFYYVPSVATTLTTFLSEDGLLAVAETDIPLSEDGSILDPLDATDVYSMEDGDIAAGIGDNDIELFYVSSPADMTLGSDEPDIPPWSHGLILFWMLGRAYESDTMLQNSGAAGLYMHLANKVIGRLAVRSKGKLPKVWRQQGSFTGDSEPDVDSRFQYASET